MKKKIVVFEVEGGTDKCINGLRKDTIPIVNAIKNLDWECKSNPNTGREKVTDMWTLDPIINLIFWVPPFETNEYATAAWGNSSEDNAPGGRFGTLFGTQGGDIDQNKVTFLLKEFFYLLTGSKRTTFSQHINNFTMMPSYSSADLRFPSLTDNSNKNLYMDWSHTYLCGHTPFDYVYAPKDSNEQHVFVSQQGSEWFESEVRCTRPDLPVFFDPNINGPATVCNSEIYSIPFCQQNNHSVTWSVSDPNIASVSGSGDQITLNRISSGIVTLTATITFSCAYLTPIIITKNIIIGTPTPIIQYVTYYGQDVGVTALYIPGATYNWYEDNVLTEAGGSNTYVTGIPCNTPVLISVEAVTNCGTSNRANKGVYAKCSSGGLSFTASPNPTYSSMSVQLTDAKGQASTDPAQKFYELQVTDKLGTVKKQYKYAGGVKQTSIDLSTLPADLYILRLWDGKAWSSLEIIKK